MNDNHADKPFHSAREHMPVERRTHVELRRNRGPARKMRTAADQKLCRHPTPVWEGAYSGHNPEGQKGAACSEAPVFGREFNCISTRRKIKPGHHEGVQFTIG
jgi:hypothetical protein